LIVDVDQFDFVENKGDLGKIIEKIDAELNGLF
jgi:deoxyadenosine/deoxycytidine kinase